MPRSGTSVFVSWLALALRAAGDGRATLWYTSLATHGHWFGAFIVCCVCYVYHIDYRRCDVCATWLA